MTMDPIYSLKYDAKKFKTPYLVKDSGTGLGLPIVQAIVESHGGILKISNAPDGGAHIVIEFPAPAEKKEELPHE